MLTRKPVEGDKVKWPDSPIVYTVVNPPAGEVLTPGLCWILNPNRPQIDGFNPAPFIWQFADGQLNRLAEIL